MKYNDKWAISEFEPKTDVLWVQPSQDEEDESIKINAFVNGKWRAVSGNGGENYPPEDGIPVTDLDNDVQSSLSKADTAYQKPTTGIPASDLASGVQTSLGKADTALQTIKTVNGQSLVGSGDIEILEPGTIETLVIDGTPTAGSSNLITSGGVASEIVWDITARNSNATFASLSALLSDANLATLIPTTIRRGGMQIRFVQSSDNKYVQYRLKSTSFNTTPSNWIVDSIKVSETEENGLVKTSITDSSQSTKDVITKVESAKIYVHNGNAQAEVYEPCIKEIWIDSRYLSNLPFLAFAKYSTTAYLYAKPTSTSNPVWTASVGLTGKTNNTVLPIAVSVAGGTASVGDIVGYVIFKDIDTFRNSDNYGGSSSLLNYNKAISLDYNRLIWYEIFVTNDKVAEMIDAALSVEIEDVLPPVIYATVGVELNLYNDAVALSMDKGLDSPINYIVRWNCSKGILTNRGFRITPTNNDIGDTIINCYIYTTDGKLATTKQSVIRVVAPSITSQKNILFVGDSTGQGSVNATYNDFSNVSLYEGTSPNFVGSKGTTPKWEGFGGARWADFSTVGRKAFRCQVSGVGEIALNSTYTNNGFTWTVVEVNVTLGVGNILITKNDLPSSVDAPQTNGTLIPTAGGENISYTDATEDSGNPFWHNNAVDFTHYRSVIGLSEHIDIVVVQLGLNGFESIETTRQYIIDFYNAAVADNEDCVVILGLIPGPANTLDAFGVSGNWMSTIDLYFKRRKLYIELSKSGNYPNLRIATPNLNIDRYYGYPLNTRAVSSRNETLETYHTNYVHPETSGYAQIGDAYFPAIIATLNE